VSYLVALSGVCYLVAAGSILIRSPQYERRSSRLLTLLPKEHK